MQGREERKREGDLTETGDMYKSLSTLATQPLNMHPHTLTNAHYSLPLN